MGRSSSTRFPHRRDNPHNAQTKKSDTANCMAHPSRNSRIPEQARPAPTTAKCLESHFPRFASRKEKTKREEKVHPRRRNCDTQKKTQPRRDSKHQKRQAQERDYHDRRKNPCKKRPQELGDNTRQAQNGKTDRNADKNAHAMKPIIRLGGDNPVASPQNQRGQGHSHSHANRNTCHTFCVDEPHKKTTPPPVPVRPQFSTTAAGFIPSQTAPPAPLHHTHWEARQEFTKKGDRGSRDSPTLCHSIALETGQYSPLHRHRNAANRRVREERTGNP